jgi:hypothetical protein
LVDSLLCAAKNVHDNLRKATEASEQIRITMDEQIGQLVLSISNQEQHVRESQQTVNQANSNIQNAQQYVTIEEAAVCDSEHSLNMTSNAVNEAHEAMEQARRCGILRHKKRFFMVFLKN